MKNINIKILASIIFVLFAYLGALTFTVPQLKNNISQATTAEPEKYTELYFEEHLNLPKSIQPKEQQTFSFTIHNLENETMTYPYEVYVQDTAGSRSGIITNTVTLRHDEKKTITETYEILTTLKRAKVVVELLNKNQQIHYWIGEENK